MCVCGRDDLGNCGLVIVICADGVCSLAEARRSRWAFKQTLFSKINQLLDCACPCVSFLRPRLFSRKYYNEVSKFVVCHRTVDSRSNPDSQSPARKSRDKKRRSIRLAGYLSLIALSCIPGS